MPAPYSFSEDCVTRISARQPGLEQRQRFPACILIGFTRPLPPRKFRNSSKFPLANALALPVRQRRLVDLLREDRWNFENGRRVEPHAQFTAHDREAVEIRRGSMASERSFPRPNSGVLRNPSRRRAKAYNPEETRTLKDGSVHRAAGGRRARTLAE